MENFEYARPKTLAKAVELLGTNRTEAELLAGGTDLLARMKDYISSPRRVVSLKGIPELGGIRAESGGTVVGALTTIEQVARTPPLARTFLRFRARPKLLRVRKSGRWPRLAVIFASGRAAGITTVVLDCWRRTPPANRWYPTAKTAITRFSEMKGRRTTCTHRAWRRR